LVKIAIAQYNSCWLSIGLVRLNSFHANILEKNLARGACTLILLALWLGGPVAVAEPPARRPDDVMLKGKVETLAAALKAANPGLHVDTETIARQVVLVGDDGVITPLLSDEASRALFLDERLRDRPAEIRGKRFAGLPYLQVIGFKIEQDGRYQTPEYYCNICTISVRYPQTCPCCQGPMELRMKPERR
jgi:hypothetical protein